MDLWQLSVFKQVVELNGFSKAAKAVHLSQPTVSSHIKYLEKHFGCRLIDRIEKKAFPTQAGKILYYYTTKLLKLKEKMENAMGDFQGKVAGRLKIGGSTIPGGYILPAIIGDFIKKYPEAQMSITISDTEDIINSILSGELELGIVGAKSKNKKIVQEKLMDDDMRLIVPHNHKWADKSVIELQLLLKEPFIIRKSGSGTLQSIQDSFRKKGLDSKKLNIVAELGNTTAIIQGIKNQVGISIISPLAVADELKAGSLKALKIEAIDTKRQFYLTSYKGRESSLLSNTFMKIIKEKVKTTSSAI